MLPVAIFVWGLIAYKIMAGLKAEGDNPSFTTDTTNYFMSTLDADTFSLILAYKDPFLGKNLYQHQEPSESYNEYNLQYKKQEESIKQPAVLKWPAISYLGLILNKKNGNYVSLLKIENKEHILLEGQEAKGIKVLKAYPDSVIVQFQKEIKTYQK